MKADGRLRPGPQSRSLTHIPGLDGLRALAILSVFAYHLRRWGPLTLGRHGVQLFFVISGFLITRILLSSRDRPGYFRDFYIRRTLRIFPIYYLYIAAVAVFALVQGRTIAELPWYLTYTQTWPMIVQLSTRTLPATAHTWSLAVEEQFYLLWPLVVWRARGRSLPVILLAAIVAAPLARLVLALSTRNPYLLDSTLPAELDALAAGALLAWLVHAGLPDRVLRRLGVAALALGGLATAVLVSRIGLDALPDPYRWALRPINALLLSALAIAFGGLVAVTVSGARSLAWLETPLLRWVGARSYGLYMYHYAIFLAAAAVVRPSGHGGALHWMLQGVLAVGVTFAAAELSWRLVERPALALKDRFAPAR